MASIYDRLGDLNNAYSDFPDVNLSGLEALARSVSSDIPLTAASLALNPISPLVGAVPKIDSALNQAGSTLDKAFVSEEENPFYNLRSLLANMGYLGAGLPYEALGRSGILGRFNQGINSSISGIMNAFGKKTNSQKLEDAFDQMTQENLSKESTSGGITRQDVLENFQKKESKDPPITTDPRFDNTARGGGLEPKEIKQQKMSPLGMSPGERMARFGKFAYGGTVAPQSGPMSEGVGTLYRMK